MPHKSPLSSTQSREAREPIRQILILFFPARAAEMDITMIGLQNAGKTSLLRVLAVSSIPNAVPIFEDLETNSGGSIGRRVHYRVCVPFVMMQAIS